MVPVKIGIIDDNQDFCQLLRDFFANQSEIQVIFHGHNGMEAIQLIEKHTIDVLLLDMIMPQVDGFGVLEWLKKRPQRPKVIVFSAFAQEEIARKAVALGVDYYVLKPFNLTILTQRILEIARDKSVGFMANPQSDGANLEMEVAKILHRLNISSHYKGYNYLRDAVLLTIKEPTIINEVTKRLYPTIAERYGTTAHRVERAMRFAIESAWNKGEVDTLHRLFGYCVDDRKGKPTNASFVAIIADKIRLEKRLKVNE